MTSKTQEALNHAKRLYTQREYKEAADYIYKNMDETERDNPPACVSFFEGECFDKLKDYRMAIDCFKNAYLSSLGEAIQAIQPKESA